MTNDKDLLAAQEDLRIHQVELEMQNEELRKAQLELEDLKNKYLDLYDNAPVGYLVLSQSGLIQEINLTGAHVLEVPREHLIGKYLSKFLQESEGDVLYLHFQHVIQTRSIQSCVVRLISRSGSIISLRLDTSLRNPSDSQVTFLTSLTDLSEVENIHQELSTEKLMLSTLVNTIPDLVWLKDPNGVYLMCNPRFEEFFGPNVEDIIGKTDYDFVDSDLADFFREHDKKAMAAGKPSSNEEWVTFARDGHRELLDTVKTPMYNEDGELIGVLGVARDITAARSAEEELFASKRDWEDTFNSIEDMITIHDQDYNIVHYNTAARELKLSRSTSEVIKCFKFYHGTDCPPAGCPSCQCLESKRASTFEFFEPHLDKFVEVRVLPRFSREGQVTGLIHIVRDISERKMMEELTRIRLELLECAASRNLHDLLQKTIDEICNLTNSSVGFYHFINDDEKSISLQAWSSRTEIEFCKAEGKGLHYPINQAGIWADAVREKKAIIHNDYLAVPNRRGLPEGHASLIRELIVPIIRSGRVVATLGVGNKLTEYTAKDVEIVSYLAGITWEFAEHKRTEEELKLREDQYRTLFEESIDGVYSVLRDGTLTDANSSFCELFGYTKDELIGSNVLKLYIDLRDRKKFQDTIETEGHVKDYEVKLKKSDGREVDCLLSSSLVLDENNAIVGYRGVLRDLTTRKLLHQQLIQSQKMEAVGILAGGIAHDFNNILQVVLGYSELVACDDKLPSYMKGDLDRVLAAAHNGADLVQRLMTFSRKSDSTPLYLDLNNRICQTQKLLERTIPKMISIHLELSDNIDTIFADPVQIDQILMNLAVNARDSMLDGGTLVIRTENVIIDESYTKLYLDVTPGKYVCLRVSDTGTGMSKDVVSRIFEPFYTTKSPGKGTGLGLAMVFGIVKSHHGFINCYSDLGKGSTFNIYFPSVTHTDKDNLAHIDEPVMGGTETILLVDDEEWIRELGERILTKSGYQILTASDGSEALSVYQLRKKDISLVILDLIMPEMGGKQCYEKLLAINPNLKVIIASGHIMNDEFSEGSEFCQAAGCISKPYNMKRMLESVRDALNK